MICDKCGKPAQLDERGNVKPHLGRALFRCGEAGEPTARTVATPMPPAEEPTPPKKPRRK